MPMWAMQFPTHHGFMKALWGNLQVWRICYSMDGLVPRGVGDKVKKWQRREGKGCVYYSHHNGSLIQEKCYRSMLHIVIHGSKTSSIILIVDPKAHHPFSSYWISTTMIRRARGVLCIHRPSNKVERNDRSSWVRC